MTIDPLTVGAGIGQRLCDEAIRDGGSAVWLGDAKEHIAGRWEVVHRSVGGDLYDGTAGIGLFLTRLFSLTRQERFRDAAAAAFQHAVDWHERERTPGSLYAGSAGIAAALAEGAAVLESDRLRAAAERVARQAIDRPARETDLIAGKAGAIIALLELARALDMAEARQAAISLGHQLCDAAIGAPFPGASWESDIEPDGSPLCGLAHGASGFAWALTELSLATGDDRFAKVAADAAAYERAWFQREQGNWPDLREYTRDKLARGELPSFPVFWCHGAIGIGLVRLRQFEITRETVYAVEAETALLTAERTLAQIVEQERSPDICLCHGIAGFAELFIEAARVFEQPDLRAKAMTCAHFASEVTDQGARPWGCGVPGGGETPGLMLGLAGIGMMFLRAADDRVAPVGLPYTQPVVHPRIIVQLDDSAPPADLQSRAADLVKIVPGSSIERISPRGRILLRIPSTVSIDDATRRLGQARGVKYAEADVIDRAVDG